MLDFCTFDRLVEITVLDHLHYFFIYITLWVRQGTGIKSWLRSALWLASSNEPTNQNTKHALILTSLTRTEAPDIFATTTPNNVTKNYAKQIYHGEMRLKECLNRNFVWVLRGMKINDTQGSQQTQCPLNLHLFLRL